MTLDTILAFCLLLIAALAYDNRHHWPHLERHTED